MDNYDWLTWVGKWKGATKSIWVSTMVRSYIAYPSCFIFIFHTFMASCTHVRYITSNFSFHIFAPALASSVRFFPWTWRRSKIRFESKKRVDDCKEKRIHYFVLPTQRILTLFFTSFSLRLNVDRFRRQKILKRQWSPLSACLQSSYFIQDFNIWTRFISSSLSLRVSGGRQSKDSRLIILCAKYCEGKIK